MNNKSKKNNIEKIDKDIFALFLKGLSQNEDITYEEDNDLLSGYELFSSNNAFEEEPKYFKENDNGDKILSSYEASIESASRDIFWSVSNFLENLDESIQVALEDNDYQRVSKAFDFKNAQVVLDISDRDEDGFVEEFWFANFDKGWCMMVRGYMGEFCDENYDAYATFSFLLNKNEKIIKNHIRRKINSHIESIANEMETNINQLLASIPKDMREQQSHNVFKILGGLKLFAPVLAKKQKEEILSSIEEVSDEKVKSKKVNTPKKI